MVVLVCNSCGLLPGSSENNGKGHVISADSSDDRTSLCRDTCAKFETCDSATDESDCRDACLADQTYSSQLWDAYASCVDAMSCASLHDQVADCVEGQALRNFDVDDSGESFCSTLASKTAECEDDVDEGSLRDSCNDDFAVLFSDAFLDDFRDCYESSSCDKLERCWDDAPKKFPLENQAMDGGILVPLFNRFFDDLPSSSPCEQAARITEDDCQIEPGTNGGSSTDAPDCTGDTAALAQCAVDNQQAYCAFLDDPLGAGNDNAYATCVAAVNGN